MPTPNCPTRPAMLEYMAGRLPDEQSVSIAEHLATCAACQDTLLTLDEPTDLLLAALRAPLPDNGYLQESQCDQAVNRAKAALAQSLSSEAVRTAAVNEGLTLPAQLGEYRVLEKLGGGGMGEVYKALQVKLELVVALKVLPRDVMQNPRAVARFEREMKAVARLNHPHIVQTYDAREIDGIHLLAMEYVAGVDLARLVRHCGPLSVADACELVRQAALGLQYAYKHGMVHRDVKPSNLMLGRDGQVKLLDMGLALVAGAEPGEAEMTDPGQVIGTADYMAPEQISSSHAVDIRADIYSLGCTLYKLLSGHAPFSGPGYASRAATLAAQVRDTASAAELASLHVPRALLAVLTRMLAKAPADRYATPAEVAETLQAFTAGCDLPALADKCLRATADVPLSEQAPVSAQPVSSAPSVAVPDRVRRPRLPASERRPILPRVLRKYPRTAILLGLTSLAVVTLGVVIIRLRNRSGRETVIESPGAEEVTVEANGQTVKISGLKSDVAEKTVPSQKSADGVRSTQVAAATIPGWETPTFPATAPGPVQLRYRLQPERVFQMVVEVPHFNESLREPVWRHTGTHHLVARCETRSVDAEGNAQVVLTINRLIRKSSMRLSFDSLRDADTKEPLLQHLAALVNQPLAMTVSPTGHIPDFGWRPLLEVHRRLGFISRKQRESLEASELQADVGYLALNAFIELPEQPVRPGDVLRTADDYACLPAMWVRTPLTLRVSAISHDKRQALFESTAGRACPLPSKEEPDVTLDSIDYKQWVLFDIEEGHVCRSYSQCVALTSDGIKHSTTTCYRRGEAADPEGPPNTKTSRTAPPDPEEHETARTPIPSSGVPDVKARRVHGRSRSCR